MALLHVNYNSEALGMLVSMDVILPQKTSWIKGDVPPHQTLYLLPGGGVDETYWQRYTPIEKLAEGYNLAVIMPYLIGRFFYADMPLGQKWWSFLSDELPDICQNMFRLSNEREGIPWSIQTESCLIY